MVNRLDLHNALIEIMQDKKKVFFNPPTNTSMTYPCIVYMLNNRNSVYANNKRYMNKKSYTVTIISKDPFVGEQLCDKVECLTYADFDRPYIADGLYHYVYTITI